MIFSAEVIGAERKERLSILSEKIAAHAEYRAGVQQLAILHPESIGESLALLAAIFVRALHGVEARLQRLYKIDAGVRRRVRTRYLLGGNQAISGQQLQGHLAALRGLPFRTTQMYDHLRYFAGFQCRILHLQREHRSALRRIVGGGAKQRNAVLRIPIVISRFEVEHHHSSAHTIGHIDRRGDFGARHIRHVAETIHLPLQNEIARSVQPHLWKKAVSFAPGELGFVLLWNLVGVYDTNLTRISVLRRRLCVLPIVRSYRHAKRLAADYQQIAAAAQVAENAAPCFLRETPIRRAAPANQRP